MGVARNQANVSIPVKYCGLEILFTTSAFNKQTMGCKAWLAAQLYKQDDLYYYGVTDK